MSFGNWETIKKPTNGCLCCGTHEWMSSSCLPPLEPTGCHSSGMTSAPDRARRLTRFGRPPSLAARRGRTMATDRDP
uniref:Uncharacterized protein n=1 Tax=Sphaerodactylus townsendi TaxID=933632 RepID=A0ACB8EK44_9SAUR